MSKIADQRALQWRAVASSTTDGSTLRLLPMERAANQDSRTPPVIQDEGQQEGGEGGPSFTNIITPPKKNSVQDFERDTVCKETINPSKIDFREINVDKIIPFVLDQQSLIGAVPNVSATLNAGTFGRPLMPPGAKVISSGNKHYEVLPIVNVQVIDCDGNPIQLKTLMDTGSTTSFISVSATNYRILMLGETDEIHVDKYPGGTDSIPSKQISFNCWISFQRISKQTSSKLAPS